MQLLASDTGSVSFTLLYSLPLWLELMSLTLLSISFKVELLNGTKNGTPCSYKAYTCAVACRAVVSIVLISSEIDICGQQADINQSFSSSNFTPFCLFSQVLLV